jgi:hypothetical protein
MRSAGNIHQVCQLELSVESNSLVVEVLAENAIRANYIVTLISISS